MFIAGRIGNALITSLLMFVLVTALGRVLFGVPVPWPRLAALLVALVVGSASFCALGVALASFIPSREAAPAITNLVVFPLYFLSGVFIPESEIPSGVLHVADVFPIRHLFDALLAGFDPSTAAGGVRAGRPRDGCRVGPRRTGVALRRFRWEPRM